MASPATPPPSPSSPREAMTQERLLGRWLEQCAGLHGAHFNAARHYERRNLQLGIPVVILSAVTGTSIFATLSQASPRQDLRIFIGMVSLTAAILASLQTFLSFSARSEKHKAVSVRYGALKREIEQALATCTPEKPCTEEFVKLIRSRIDALDEEAPNLRRRVYSALIGSAGSGQVPPIT